MSGIHVWQPILRSIVTRSGLKVRSALSIVSALFGSMLGSGRRRWRNPGLRGAVLNGFLAALLGVAVSPLTPRAVAEDATVSVDAWTTVGSTRPAVGCIVDVSVEVRGDSGPRANLDIALGLVVDGEILDVPRAVTGADGIAYLALDTSVAYPGAATRIEVNIAGTYADRMDLTPTDDGPCSGEPSMATARADIWAPDELPTPAAAEDAGEPGNADTARSAFLSVTTYRQQRSLSCEYAALSIATAALGSWVSEYAFDELVGWSPNPHWGFRGDINGEWGNTVDYGVYPEALVGPLAQFGFSGEVMYGADAESLRAHLDAGMPTLVWLGLWGDTSFYESLDDGTSFKLASGYHNVVAYGYDDWGVYVSDPGVGMYRAYDWATFLTMWNVMDGMALAVSVA